MHIHVYRVMQLSPIPLRVVAFYTVTLHDIGLDDHSTARAHHAVRARHWIDLNQNNLHDRNAHHIVRMRPVEWGFRELVLYMSANMFVCDIEREVSRGIGHLLQHA